MNHAATTTPANFWRRIAAMGYDSLLVIPLMMAVTAMTVGIKAAIVGPDTIQQSHQAALSGVGYWLNAALALTVAATFFIFCWVRGGRTLGMQAWKLYVVNEQGHGISYRQALVRLAGALVSWSCLGLGYLWVFIDKEQRTWHEIWSGTRTIRVIPPKK